MPYPKSDQRNKPRRRKAKKSSGPLPSPFAIGMGGPSELLGQYSNGAFNTPSTQPPRLTTPEASNRSSTLSNFGEVLNRALNDVVDITSNAYRKSTVTDQFKNTGGGTKKPGGNDGVVEKAPPDPLDALLAEAAARVGSAESTYDYEAALQAGADAIRKSYRAEIGAVKRGGRRARRQTARNREDVEDLFNALGASYRRSAAIEQSQGEREAKAIEGISRNTSKHVENVGKDIIQQQAGLARATGLGDIAGNTTGPTAKQIQKQTSKIAARGERGATQALKISGSQRRFLNAEGQGAQFEGVQRSADLVADLQDFLQANQDKIASLRGARARELAANLQSTQAAAAKAQSDAQADVFEQLMALTGMKLKIEDTRADNLQNNLQLDQDASEFAAKLAAGYFNKTGTGGRSPETGVPDYMNNVALNVARTSQPRRNMSFMESLLQHRMFREMNFITRNKREVKLTPEQAARKARLEAIKAGIPPQDIPEIMNAARAYVLGQ